MDINNKIFCIKEVPHLCHQHFLIIIIILERQYLDIIIILHIHDLAFLLAICNRYIPIYDTNGNLLVTMEEFKELRRKMSGLSEYDAGEFQFSDNLNLPDIEVLMKDMEKDRFAE